MIWTVALNELLLVLELYSFFFLSILLTLDNICLMEDGGVTEFE